MDRLPDQLRPDLRLVFVGTAASTRSADLGHYYAHPGNRFWPTLYEVGITPRRYAPREFASLLSSGSASPISASPARAWTIRFRLGRRHRGVQDQDADISPSHNRLHQQEGREPVLRSADTGDRLRPAAAGGWLSGVFVLASPSGAASGIGRCSRGENWRLDAELLRVAARLRRSYHSDACAGAPPLPLLRGRVGAGKPHTPAPEASDFAEASWSGGQVGSPRVAPPGCSVRKAGEGARAGRGWKR